MSRKYNCTVHGKPMYRVRAKIGNDLNGKAIFKSFYGDGKIEAEKKRDSYLVKQQTTDKTLGQLADYYTYNVLLQENISPGTISLYESAYRRLLKGSPISVKPVTDLTPVDIQGFIAKHKHTALTNYTKRLFRWLSSQGLCHDLASGIMTPKAKRKSEDISTFSEEEVQSIINTENSLHGLFLLALATGLREGELLALRYSDIKGGCVHVSRQLAEIYTVDSDGFRQYEKIIKTPKADSVRVVPIPDSVLAELPEGRSDSTMFTTASGGFLDKGNFRRAWQRHLKKAGVPYKKFHSCRATYCTLLCKNGVSLETAAKLMGHSDVTVTAKYYRLVSNDEMTSAVDRINGLFQKPSGDKVATDSKENKKREG